MFKVPLIWMNKDQYRACIDEKYRVEPVAGYHETSDGYRAYQIFLHNNPDDDLEILYLRHNIKIYNVIPIYDDFKLTAKYVHFIGNTEDTGSQMFDRLDDDEKINILDFDDWNFSMCEKINEWFSIEKNVEYAKKRIIDVYRTNC